MTRRAACAGMAVAALLLVGLTRADEAFAEDAPASGLEAAVPLDRAVSQGLVTVRGDTPESYSTVRVTIENRTDSPVIVDVAGRHLVPTTGPVQRLGLAHPTTPVDPTPGRRPGTSPLTLAPRETRELRVNSCCLDAGKECPRPKDRYVLSKAPTPPVAEAALRWWVDHPAAPQGVVNAAIWQRQLDLLSVGAAGRASEPEPDPPWPKGRFVRSYGGIVYLLEDGALTSVDPEGVRRFHATGIYQVFPDADGLLAVGRGVSGREMWRFGVTGDPPWTKLFSLQEDALDTLLRGPGGAFLLHRGTHLRFRATKDAPEVDVALSGRDDAELTSLELGALDASRGRAVAFGWRKATPAGGSTSSANVRARAPKVDLFDVSLASGTAARRKTFWNVRHFAAGPAGLFSLSPAGALERLEGTKARRVLSDRGWRRIVAVGSERLLLEAEDGGLYVSEAKGGRSTALPADASDVTIDPVTDDLVWIASDRALRWSPARTAVESFPLR
jgi:hypothetical protein